MFERWRGAEEEKRVLHPQASLQEEKSALEKLRGEKKKKIARAMALVSALAFAPGMVPEVHGDPMNQSTEANPKFKHDPSKGEHPMNLVENREGLGEIVDLTQMEATTARSPFLCLIGFEELPFASDFSSEDAKKKEGEIGPMLGQKTAEYLEEHPQAIPQEWKKYRASNGERLNNVMLLFPGTVWQEQNGRLYVPALDELSEDHWNFRWFALDEHPSGGDCRARFVHLHPVEKK